MSPLVQLLIAKFPSRLNRESSRPNREISEGEHGNWTLVWKWIDDQKRGQSPHSQSYSPILMPALEGKTGPDMLALSSSARDPLLTSSNTNYPVARAVMTGTVLA